MKKNIVKWGMVGFLVIGLFVFGKIEMTYAEEPCGPNQTIGEGGYCIDKPKSASEPLKKIDTPIKTLQTSTPQPSQAANDALRRSAGIDICAGLEGEKCKEKCSNLSNANNSTCTKAYSCESLFLADVNQARICNWQRCAAEKGYVPTTTAPKDMDFSCNCKYGVNGDGVKTGIPLNTNFPFIGRCLEKKGSDGDATATAPSVFPTIIGALSKMLVIIILTVGVIMIIIGGIQWASGDPKAGKEKIKKVAIGFLLLGAMGAILALINPNFFK